MAPPIDLDIAKKFAEGETGARLGRHLGISTLAVYRRLHKFAVRWAPECYEAANSGPFYEYGGPRVPAGELRRIIQKIISGRTEWPEIGVRYRHVDGIVISTRVANGLRNLQLHSWAEVDQRRDELHHTARKRFNNLGAVSYWEVSEALVSRGFRPLREWKSKSAPRREIEVTPEMIDAGLDRLETVQDSSSDRLATEVYRAMEHARRHRSSDGGADPF